MCISFKLIALLYCKSVDRIFTLTVRVLITKTDDGSFNCHVDIVNFSSFGFLILTTQNFLQLNNYNIAHLKGL